MPRIQSQSLNHWIDNFYGYGSWRAPFWFVAYEESGGETVDEVGEKFQYFVNAHPDTRPALCDIRELYKHVTFRMDGPRADLFENRYDFRFGSNAVLHGVWKNLIDFVQGYTGESIGDILDYQKNRFVTDREALIRLFPLPGPHSHAWYYSWLDLPDCGFLKTRALYEEHVYEKRIRTILENIHTHKPGIVLMYGMNHINMLKKSVQEFFSGATFKTVKAVKQQLPQHHRADLGATTLLITTQIPALRHGRVETGFEWGVFGGTCK